MAKSISNVIRRELQNIYLGTENLGRIGEYEFRYGWTKESTHRRLSFRFVMRQSSIEELRWLDKFSAVASTLRFEWQKAQKDFVVPEVRTHKLRVVFCETKDDEISTIEVEYSGRVKKVIENETEIIFRVPMMSKV